MSLVQPTYATQFSLHQHAEDMPTQFSLHQHAEDMHPGQLYVSQSTYTNYKQPNISIASLVETILRLQLL
jgi:hypothetical protein